MTKDRREERILRRLGHLGEGPSAFFADACRLMADDGGLKTKVHLVAHLLREVDGAVRDVLRPLAERAGYLETPPSDGSEKVGGRHRDELKAILQALDVPAVDQAANVWLKATGDVLPGRAHRSSLLGPRRPDETLDDIWNKMLDVLDLTLDRLEAKYLQLYAEVETLAGKQQPSNGDMKMLKKAVPNGFVTRAKFFQALSHWQWLKPLEAAGFFSDPPALRWYPDGKYSTPPWPESRFLARMAKLPEAAADVLSVALGIPETYNPSVNEDLVEVALFLPPSDAVRLVPRAKQLVEGHHGWWRPETGADLVVHMAKGGFVEEAIDLARTLLGVRQREGLSRSVEGRFDGWHYAKVVLRIREPLVTSAPQATIDMLADLIAAALLMANPEGPPRDHSFLTRPAIGEQVHNRGHHDDVLDLLIVALRDSSVEALERHQVDLACLIESFEHREWHLFQRLSLFLLSRFPDRAPSLVEKALMDHGRFECCDVECEYFGLLQVGFRRLDRDAQQRVLGWIQDGPGWAKGESALSGQDGARSTYWRAGRLRPILEDVPPDWQARYRDWVGRVGEPEPPGSRRHRSSFFCGPNSPQTAAALETMGLDELVAFLQTWEPTGDWMAPSREGLGRELSKAVADAPDLFSTNARRFVSLDPTYVRAVLHGLRDGFTKATAFDWNAVVDLCGWVGAQPRELHRGTAESEDQDPHWGWARKAAANLLSVGFEVGPQALLPSIRGVLWSALAPLAEDPEPTPEDDEKRTERELTSAAINSVRSVALETVIQYYWWACRAARTTANALPRGSESVPEATALLERHLDPVTDPSVIVRSVYGRYFPLLFHLDSGWARTLTSTVFPDTPSSTHLWRAAWETYLLRAEYWNQVELFELLRPQYQRALNDIVPGAVPTADAMGHDPATQVGWHLVASYALGVIDLSDPLLQSFFTSASPKLRAKVIDVVGRSLQVDALKPSDVQARLRSLCDARMAACSAALGDSKEELAAYGWWFALGEFVHPWSFRALSVTLDGAGRIEGEHFVMERLAELASVHPFECVSMFARLIDGDQEDWSFYGEEARDLLRRVLAGESEDARRAAVDVINRLAAQGKFEFRELLK